MSTTVTDRQAGSAVAHIADGLRQAPTTLPALVAVAGMVVWATSQAGYPLTHWAPGGLVALALLGIATVAVPPRWSEIPPAVRVAALCLAAYTALSFLSILWANVPGDAWEGADRTLLYLLVFLLFACWRQTGVSAALLLVVWTLALIGLAAFTALHIADGDLASLLPGGRLGYPTGYPNANAAQWLMAFWPAVLLARSERLWWGLRGVLAGGAVLLAAVALLSQSRGALYATPVMLVLVFALLPGRARTFALLLPVVAGIGAITPAVLRVGERLEHGGDARGALHSATVAMFVAALGVGLVVAAAAAVEGRVVLSPAVATRVRRGVGTLAVLTLVAILAGGWVAAGNPLTRLEHGWRSFKSPNAYAADSATGSRLTSGLGSNRYDFYRVALDEFTAHPLVGIGVDNFAQQYLQRGHSLETPHYPHSVELRTLSQTGLVGTLLALVGLLSALFAALQGIRTPAHTSSQPGEAPGTGLDPLGRYVAAAALAGFGYWAVHGSVDWFWEFAGLGAPAFALLGLACALTPRMPALALPSAALTSGAALASEGLTLAPESPAFAPEGSAPAPQSPPPARESSTWGLGRPAPGPEHPTPAQGSAAAPAQGDAAAPQGSSAAALHLQIPPAAPRSPSPAPTGRRRRPQRLALTLAALALAAVAAASFLAPWLSQLEVQSAARVWPASPAKAYTRLNDAAHLNPLSDEPYLVAGSIALRLGEVGRADHQFALALQRVPNDAYATLERGAIASSRGQRALALALLTRAAALDPRDSLTRAALALARQGQRVNVTELNRSILREAQQLS
jgi:O-antigen ligase